MQRFKSPDKKYKGYIFDLDGTLVDSMPLHYKAWRTALKKAGAPYEAFLTEEFYSCGGKSASDVVAYLNEKYHINMNADSVSEHKRECYLNLVETEGVQPIREVVEFAQQVSIDASIAIATGSAMPGAIATLRQAGIDNLFSIIITPEDVKRGKPFPDMFLLAAEKINIDPSYCVVFEDAIPGITAAEAAGMDYVVVKTPEEYLKGNSIDN